MADVTLRKTTSRRYSCSWWVCPRYMYEITKTYVWFLITRTGASQRETHEISLSAKLGDSSIVIGVRRHSKPPNDRSIDQRESDSRLPLKRTRSHEPATRVNLDEGSSINQFFLPLSLFSSFYLFTPLLYLPLYYFFFYINTVHRCSSLLLFSRRQLLKTFLFFSSTSLS